MIGEGLRKRVLVHVWWREVLFREIKAPQWADLGEMSFIFDTYV